MGPVYPIMEKEEPPEDKPGKGGQEEEPGKDKDKDKEKWEEKWEENLEEKYLEEACQEERDFIEAKEEYERETQAAKEKFETRTGGKTGITLISGIPHMPNRILQEIQPTSPQLGIKRLRPLRFDCT